MLRELLAAIKAQQERGRLECDLSERLLCPSVTSFAVLRGASASEKPGAGKRDCEGQNRH
jgi:hypothetical protein